MQHPSSAFSSPRLLLPLCLLVAATGCDPGGADEGPPNQADRRPRPDGPPGGPFGPGQDGQDLAERVRADAARRGVTPTPAAPEVTTPMWVLGQALAFDKILSGNRDVSCMTCHHPGIGTDDDRALPLGVGGEGLGLARAGGTVIPRNAPQLFNLHTYPTMFWDSRIERRGQGLQTPAGAQLTEEMESVFDHGVVSAQAMFPVTSREEMRGAEGDNELAGLADDDFEGIWAALMDRLGDIPAYPVMFEEAYPGQRFEDMSFAHAANAIAAFEVAAFESRQSPWDQFLVGDDTALDPVALRGAAAFFGRGCASCHRGVGLSDFRHHNIALPQFGPGKGDGASGRDDFGRERVTGDADDRYAFRTPPLFNVELTAPYGHTGEFATLRRHVVHYADPRDSLLGYDIEREVADAALWSTLLDNAAALLTNPSPRLGRVRLRGDDEAVDDMVVFLESLTDEDARDLAGLVPDTVPSGLPVAD